MKQPVELEPRGNLRDEPPPAPRRRWLRRPWMRWALPIFIIVLASAAYGYWRYASVRESTDDAQIDGHIHPISARVSGAVIAVHADNNQYVNAGALLVEIDPKDYQVALDRARADLAEAEASLQAQRTAVPITSASTASQLLSSQAGVADAKAAIAAAQTQVEAARAHAASAQARVNEVKANYEKAAADLVRMKALVAKDEISRQQYDSAVAAAEAARAQTESLQAQAAEAQNGVQVAQRQLQQAEARLAQAEAAVQAARTAPQQVQSTEARAQSQAGKVEQMKAALAQAELNLQYTSIRAPISGIASQRSAEVGQVVQLGQAVLSIVPVEDIWVTANFKETQLRDMRPGQRATIQVDAYGGREYRGHVDSIAAATGARFSILPPENATGNYVKVVQRLPVKIVFDKGQDPEHLLRPGMSVVPTVITR